MLTAQLAQTSGKGESDHQTGSTTALTGKPATPSAGTQGEHQQKGLTL